MGGTVSGSVAPAMIQRTDEASYRQLMTADAEKMSLSHFLQKYATQPDHKEWVTKFWQEINAKTVDSQHDSKDQALQEFLFPGDDGTSGDGRWYTDEQGVAEGDVVPFRRPQLTWQQVPQDVLHLANEWFWASDEDTGLDAVLDPQGYGSGTKNRLRYITAQLAQRGWTIDYNDEHDKPGEYNLVLRNKQGQSVLLSIEDAQDSRGWAQGTVDGVQEQGVAEGTGDTKTQVVGKYKGWRFEVETQAEDDRNVTYYGAVSPDGKWHSLPKRATADQFKQFVDNQKLAETTDDPINYNAAMTGSYYESADSLARLKELALRR